MKVTRGKRSDDYNSPWDLLKSRYNAGLTNSYAPSADGSYTGEKARMVDTRFRSQPREEYVRGRNRGLNRVLRISEGTVPGRLIRGLEDSGLWSIASSIGGSQPYLNASLANDVSFAKIAAFYSFRFDVDAPSSPPPFLLFTSCLSKRLEICIKL
ncbi:hypothetical protein KM043_012949 [Ampulex compressa]|nr:hypothetical protein KM043_012949 [Ampulex compressa]